MKLNIHIASFLVTAVILALVAVDADSRGRRGDSGYSRAGVASGGSFSDRAGVRSSQHTERQADRQANQGDLQDDRQQWKDESREDRQDYAEDRQEDRQDFVEDNDDHWDNRHDDWDDDDGEFLAGAIVGAAVVGTAVAASTPAPSTVYVTTLPCEATAVAVDGVSYFKCGDNWYTRGYAGSQVTYLSVPPPKGF